MADGAPRGRDDFVTRVFDILLSAVGLLLSAPLMCAAAIGIRVTSSGPILYRASRVGLGGQPFTMYKLRTMHSGGPSGGRITSARDTRVFPLGRFLRRTKVDELPQLLHVFRGEMALVGPRPEDPSIVEDHYDELMMESLTVPPGLTSPGSLCYFAEEGALPTESAEAERVYLETLLRRKIALDLVYVRNRGVGYYLELLLRTALNMVGLQRPYRGRREWEWSQANRYLTESAS